MGYVMLFSTQDSKGISSVNTGIYGCLLAPEHKGYALLLVLPCLVLQENTRDGASLNWGPFGHDQRSDFCPATVREGFPNQMGVLF